MNIQNRITEIGFALFNPKTHGARTFHLSAIINKNRILSLATNSAKTHPLNIRNPKFGFDGKEITDTKGTCSELAAFIKAKNKGNIDFGRCSLINIRIDREGKLRNSRPCFSCSNLIKYMALRSVYFTDDVGNFQKY